MTVPQLAVLLAAMPHRQWQADHPERLCRRVNRVLRRNEQARFYSWEARKRLPPKRLQQRE